MSGFDINPENSAHAFERPEPIDWEILLNQDNPPMKKATNARSMENYFQDLLDSWIAVEALSPESYKSQEKLASGINDLLMPFDIKKGEPWFHDPQPRQENKSLYYLVYLGAIRLDHASSTLIDIYGDKRAERSRIDGFSALGLVVLDESGIPLPDKGLSLSSFGWAYGRALKKRLEDLKHWSLAEVRLLEGLQKFIYRKNDKGGFVALTLSTLQEAYEWIVENCDLPQDQLVPPTFAIRIERKKGNTPETILNSFYLEELGRIKDALSEGGGGDAIKQYLGINSRKDAYDLLNGPEANKIVEEIVQPQNTPPVRWPGKGRYPLVLLQQASVNLAFQELNDPGMFSVNGPPGTGKTTLLRDIVAGILVKRAEAMSVFDDPSSAFKSVDNMKTKSGYIHFYEPDSSLLGHEIVVASSNNNAVENLTKELPMKKAIADDANELSYFKTLSDTLSGSENSTWGLIAVALGRSENRDNFSKKAWWDNNTSIRKYIDSIIYHTQEGSEDKKDIPAIVANESPPKK